MSDDKDTDDDFAMQPKPKAAEKLDDDALLRLIRERVTVAQGAMDENHRLSQHDVLFVEGENHWPAGVLAEAEHTGDPCLTLNTLPVMVERVCGEQRQNKMAISVQAGDDFGANQQFTDGKTKRKLAGASVLEGIIRAIEFRSNAEAHYDRAHQHAVDGAFGFLRVLTRYASAKSFDQELIITSVRNRWSVLLDPETNEPDGSDARYGFIGTDMLRTEFLDRYPQAGQGDLLDAARREYASTWWGGQEDRVKVAEYFSREPVTRELLLLSNGQTAYTDAIEDILQGDALVGGDGQPVAINGQPITVVRRRNVTAWQVTWRLVTANAVLEGPKVLPFTTIPIVPVYGRSRDMPSGEVRFSSLFRHAKDAVRMDEFWMSKATASVALAPRAPWTGPASAFEGYEKYWENANSRNTSYLPYNDDAAERPQRIEPPRMPTAEVQLSMTMADRVKSTIGIFDASIGAASQETSGRAINARDRQSSTTNFVYGDNLKMGIRRIGCLLVDAIPRIYDTERVMQLRNEDGTSDWIKVNQVVPVLDKQGQPVIGDDGRPEEVVLNALGTGEFDVTVTPGPAYLTQREAAADGQFSFLQIAPAYAPIIGDIVAENQNWPQAAKVAQRIRRSMDPSLLTDAEKKELEEDNAPEGGAEVDPATGQPAQKPPSPEEAQQAQAQQVVAMQMQAAQAETKAKIAQAEADMAEADAKKATAAATKLKAVADIMALGMQVPPELLQGPAPLQLPDQQQPPAPDMPPPDQGGAPMPQPQPPMMNGAPQ